MVKNNKISRRNMLLLSSVMGGYQAIGTSTAQRNQDSPDSQDYSDIIENMVGNGSESNPYVITDVIELQAMRGDDGAHYSLGNDINASETQEWNDNKGFKPVGEGFNGFTGSLNGRGYRIENLYINRPEEEEVGLFGRTIDYADIGNIGFSNCEITGGDGNVGSLIGLANNVSISNSYVDGGTVTGEFRVGGLVGHSVSSTTISVSYATADINGGRLVGGLVGANRNNAKIANSYSDSDVTGDNTIGGLVGSNSSAYITNSYATGNITGNRYLGGLVGTNRTEAEIKNSYATGNVTGDGEVIGGLVGDGGDAYVIDSYATGDVSSDTNKVGGLIGDISSFGTVKNSNAEGDIIGSSYVGGLVGFINGGTVEDSYATGNVVGNDNVGGLVGRNQQNIENSYATGDVSGDENYIGGLIGWTTTYVNKSYAMGGVDGEDRVGGLVGQSTGSVLNSYANNDVNGESEVGGLAGRVRSGTVEKSYTASSVSGSDKVGGLVGENSNSTVERSYWDTENEIVENGDDVSKDSDGGTGLTSDEMQSDSATEYMEGLDFISIWENVENYYPVLQSLSIPNERDDDEPATTEITGWVTDQDDNPVSTVSLYIAPTQQLYLGNELIDKYPNIFPPNPTDEITVTDQTETNEQGEYSFNSIPHGSYFVLAIPEPGQDPNQRNYNPQLRENVILHDEPRSIDIVLPDNRPLSALSSKVEAINTESQSQVDITTDLAARKLVGLSEISQNRLESDIYDYFSISDAMFDDDSEQTLDDRAAKANVEMLEDGVRDLILDYASDMTSSMKRVLGDASKEFLDQECVRNTVRQSPSEVSENCHQEMPFYANAQKRLDQNWELYKQTVETQVPAENFSTAEARSILDDVHRQLQEKNYGVPGVVIAPNGESYKFDQTETYADVYDTYEDLADFADTGQTVASGGKVVGGMLLLVPGGQAVGGSMIALSGKTYKAANTAESLSTASMVLSGVFTQYYWPHDINEIPAVPESTLEWLASAAEEGLSETQVELTYLDMSLSELPWWRGGDNFTVPYIGANRPKDPPSYWPFQDTAVETAQIGVRNNSGEPVAVRITMHDQFGDGNNTSVEGTMVPPPDEDPLEISPNGSISLPVEYSVNFNKFFNERIMSIGVWVNGVRRDSETVVFEVRHNLDLFSLSTADQSAEETLSTAEIDEQRAETSRIIDAEISPERPVFETVHAPTDVTEEVTYYLSATGNIALQVVDTDGNVSGYDPESDTLLTEIPESTVIGPDATPQRVKIAKKMATEYTIRAIGYRFESDSAVSVTTDVVETPKREAILSVNKTNTQVTLTTDIIERRRLSISEAGGQKPITEINITSGVFVDSEGTELDNFEVSLKQEPVDISAGETIDTTLVFDFTDGFGFPNTPDSTRFDGNITINTANAGSQKLSVSGIGIQTDVGNARLIRADDSVTGIQMNESLTEELNVELPESMSLISAYNITISGKGNVSIRLPDSLSSDNVRPLRIVGDKYEEVTVSNGNETGIVSLSDGDFTIVVVEENITEHESGVDQELFDAVDQSGDGEVNLGELRDAVEQWGETGQINGVDASLGDLRALVDWSLS